MVSKMINSLAVKSDDDKEHPTMFGIIEEKNVVFVLDTSGSMYSYINSIKEHLIEALRILSSTDCLFNIIEFSADISKFAEWLIPCNQKSWDVAKAWITAITCKTTTNTLEAVKAAFEDDRTQAVYLVSDGSPNQGSDEVIEAVKKMKNKKPIHAFYLPSKTHNKKSDMEKASEFLSKLSRATKGSFRIVIFGDDNHIKSIKTVYAAQASREDQSTIRHIKRDKNTVPSNMHIIEPKAPVSPNKPVKTSLKLRRSKLIMEMEKQGSDINQDKAYLASHGVPQLISSNTASNVPSSNISTLLQSQEVANSYTVNSDSVTPGLHSNNASQPNSSSKTRETIREDSNIDGIITSVRLQPENLSTIAGTILLNKKILCRSYADGHYYLGTVKKQVSQGQFLIDLILPKKKKLKSEQETNINDIIALNDAWRHPIKLGDKVLAPRKLGKYEYAPAVVLEGNDPRILTGKMSKSIEPMIVVFSSGLTKTIDSNSAVWISNALYEQLSMDQLVPNHLRGEMNKIIADSTDSNIAMQRPADFAPCNTYKSLYKDTYELMRPSTSHEIYSKRPFPPPGSQSFPDMTSTTYYGRSQSTTPTNHFNMNSYAQDLSPPSRDLPYHQLTSRIDEQIQTIERYLNALDPTGRRETNYYSSEEEDDLISSDPDILETMYDELGLNDDEEVIRTTSTYCKTKQKSKTKTQRPPWRSWYAAPSGTGPTERYQPKLLKEPRVNIPQPKSRGNFLDHIRMVNPDYPNWWKYQQKEIQQQRIKYEAPTLEDGLTNLKHQRYLKKEAQKVETKRLQHERQVQKEVEREQTQRAADELRRKHKLEKMAGFEQFDKQRKKYYEEMKNRLIDRRRKNYNKIRDLDDSRTLQKKEKEAKKLEYLKQQRNQREQLQIQQENEKVQRVQAIEENRLRRQYQREKIADERYIQAKELEYHKASAKLNAEVSRRKELIVNRLADEERRRQRFDVKREKAIKIKLELGY
ncbi:von Willebrand factor A domain-containing protein 3B [Trichoplax sp. H2]|nr:von Willebrand factor A domain-containing protein 3B [Trichoplax sp. H2]|eukprot:RDD40696.1 von Willebrand factor A domain-containing protein 3B [Trichoplax sp. H2]